MPRSIDIGDIFKAEPATTFKLLNEPGRCFFVPPYQRDFDWSRENVERLIGDVCRGWVQSSSEELAATFLGSIISVLSSTRDDFPEESQSQLPASIGAIVDGQQRLTTILMLCVALHNVLRGLHARLDGRSDEGETWLTEQVAQILDDIQPMFEQRMSGGDEPYILYPRLIRRPGDIWGRRKTIAKYSSPIAKLLNNYSMHLRSPECAKLFEPRSPDRDAPDFDAHELVNTTFRFILKCVGRIAKGGDSSFEVPNLSNIDKSALMQQVLMDVQFPTVVSDRLQTAIEAERDGRRDAFAKLVRVALFSRYFCRRVMVTLINAMNEEYAFDIFESLNTTGEPLTALQTLKPRVVASVASRDWETSDEKERLDVVDAYIRKFGTPAQRQRKTAELITSFALFESGYKLSLRLSAQRIWMQKRFDELSSDGDERREFVRGISTIGAFLNGVWPERPERPSEIDVGAQHAEIAKLCLGVLRQANHTISIPLIARFWGAWWKAGESEREEAATQLVLVLKAVTAFWVFWRLARRDTGGIDDIYRTLMAEGFARKPGVATTKSLSAELFREELVKKLSASGIGTRMAWTEALTKVPAYGNESAATRLALLAAMHDTVPDDTQRGLWKLGREGTNHALGFSTWASERNNTIEHVAPQKRPAGGGCDWEEALYEDTELVDLLGNLVLCPANTNSSLGNETWKYKSGVYRVVASKSNEEFDSAMSALTADGISLGGSTREFLNKHPHLYQMRAFHGFGGPWSREFVVLRTRNLAGLAWDRIAPWLGLADDPAPGLGSTRTSAVGAKDMRQYDDDDILADDLNQSE
jgi:hypothetical protein